ncbi:MAG: glucose-6-phosphate isomerase [Acinetobacter populi]|uniref:glucose-6-phosphate isomerase n=1 Tax=Acinetobacter populi TaxID=1582270 RepID=UPI002357EB7B|nr:glucose-6-phosphate isomerase [Acinetobacter populi]MCH4246393.1 glucose-6-phosphate isomerase [Acinetobacter populi]
MTSKLMLDAEQQLQLLAKKFKNLHLNDLFQSDPERFEHLHIENNGLLFDYSKERLDQNVLDQLIALANEKQLVRWIDKLFSKEHINHTEHRSAMHWALRTPRLNDEQDPDFDVNQLVHQQLDKMTEIVHKIQSGQFRGTTGEKITDVVNIGVGGSDLGPLMVCRALAPYQNATDQIKVHFASTMDGSQLSQIVENLRPASTLFIISSKSFTTVDTLSNADTARQWLIESLGDRESVMRCHFIGVSTSTEKMQNWGISPDLQLNLWDWVGGRYSLWSAIGLPIAILIGMERFKEFLQGAYFIDQHFRNADWHENLPVLLALIGIWNNNYLDIHTHAILPYDGRLEFFTSYLQQLEMESNGKSIRRDDSLVDYPTCPIIWGEVGPNAQHAFYQLLHQGTLTVSTDFIIAKTRYRNKQLSKRDKPFEALQKQHQLSISNCLAQSRLLAFGSHAVKNSESMPSYRQYYGNKPSSTIIIPQLDPFYLGALIALYEHKVFVQSVLWDINPFDQWGVEMGKAIAQELLPYIGHAEVDDTLDSSTKGLLKAFN